MIEISVVSEGTPSKEDLKLSGHGPATTQRFVTFADRQPQQPPQSSFSSMRRGISNFMTTMDAALKHSTQNVAGISPSSVFFYFNLHIQVFSPHIERMTDLQTLFPFFILR